MDAIRHPQPGILFLVLGPSGVGKDTLIDGARHVLGADGRHVFAQRVITRPVDAGGEQHQALGLQEFEGLEQRGGFLASWQAHGLRYGLLAALGDELARGRHVVANVSRGALGALVRRVPRTVVLAVSAEREALAHRIAARGREQGDDIAQRLARQVEIELPPGVERFDIHNDGSIEEGVEQLLAAIETAKRRLRVVRYPIDTWRERVAYLPPDSVIGAAAYLGPERVAIEGGERAITASVHVSEALPALAPDEIGLSRHAFDALGLPAGHRVTLVRTPAPESRAALRAKIAGAELTHAQYAMLLEDIVRGRYADSEVAAFQVACTRSLTKDEVVSVAKVRASFMPRMQWDAPIVVDKHSMGGVPGSRITLIVIPIVAAHGLAIPKTSSRAITSAAGTADAMEVLAKVDLSAAELRNVVRSTRGCIAWNGRLNHSALDDVMNHITRPLGIDSNRWSVASILSKKLSAGSTHVIVDLPWGPQAKLKTHAQALELASLFEDVGAALGLVVSAHATDGSAPIGRGIGPALEVQDVLQVLGNDANAPPDLREKALQFAARILAWDPAVADVASGRMLAEQLLVSGAARAKLDDIVDAQGRQPLVATPSALKHAVRAMSAGRIQSMDIARLSEIARRAGAPADASAGIHLAVGTGDSVAPGDLLYTIHAGAAADLAQATRLSIEDNGLS